jgi:triosephosphate isomerase (TIM)
MTAQGRTPLVVGNWKMNLSEAWAVALLDDLLPKLSPSHDVEVAVAPAFPCLRAVADRLKGTHVALGAQNVHWEDKGAFTGEVSPRMLAEMGVRLVIVGHSERRIHFGETDDRIQRKVSAARRHGIVPILCVGEQEKERDEGRTLAVVEKQLRMGLGKLAVSHGNEIVIAYEPVWAIGTGRSATPHQAQEVHRMIREQLGGMYAPAATSRIPILYGGSVTAESAGELLRLPEVDGALVGGASLDAEAFAAIVAAAR